MAYLLQIDFPFAGPFGEALAQQLAEFAATINAEPGFLWKIWTENAVEKTAGGLYLFQTEADARAYLKKHSERLPGFGITEYRARIFALNAALSQINAAPPACCR